MSKKTKYIIGAIVAVLVIGAIASGGKNDSDPPAENAVAVTATKLWQDYKENEVKAESTYKDKVVNVTGRIRKVSTNPITKDPQVSLDTEDGLFSITCEFEEANKGEVANLAKGQTVTVQGTVKDKIVNVRLEGCTLVESSKSSGDEVSDKDQATAKKAAPNSIPDEVEEENLVELTSLMLWNEYEENEVKANSLYKGSKIVVTGRVVEISTNLIGGAPQIKLEGGNPYLPVTCEFSKSDAEVIAEIAKGQEVKIKGIVQGKVVTINLKRCELVE